MAIILLIAAVISRVIGETFDATLIASLVLLGATIDFVQSYRSRKIIEHLRTKVASTASVLRDGTWQELPRRELVPQDIIRLSAGDMVPADARLLEARDLYVQQAMLTGESVPAEKMASSAPPSNSPNAPNMVFVGTSVVSGTAIAEVTATASRTAFGDIAARLSDRAPETAFDLGLRQFGYMELTRRGYRVIPQVKTGAYRIDMVVEGAGDVRLAIECDGDEYHGPDRWAHDTNRQRTLERAGWPFWRCFASTWILRKDEVLFELCERLNMMGIEPLGALERTSTMVEKRVWRIPVEDSIAANTEAERLQASLL